MSAGLVVAEVVGEHAQPFHRTARHARETDALVDVGNVDAAGLCARNATIGDDGRTLPRHKGHGLEERAVVGLGQQHDVVENIDKIEAKASVARGQRRTEDMLGIERPRVGEIRPTARKLVVHLKIAHITLDALSATRKLVDESRLRRGQRLDGDAQRMIDGAPCAIGRIVAERIAPRQRGVEQQQATVLGATMMAASHRHEQMRFAGYGAHRKERGEVAAGAVERKLSHAIGIHRHQLAGEVVLDIGIFPARVHHASVVHDAGRIVGILLKGELDRLAGPAVDPIEHAHREVAIFAR